MKRIILTGATGMIGSTLVELAVHQGYEVVCIVRKNSQRLDSIISSPLVHIIEADLSDLKTLDVPYRCDQFFHFGWDRTANANRDEVETQMQNVQYTLDAARLAKRCGCTVFVGAGSQAEYGPTASKLMVETPVHPESGYGIAKLSAGLFSRLLCQQLSIKFNWIRILSAYGPRDGAQTLITYLLKTVKEGKNPELTPCEQTWDYIYATDVAHAFFAVADKGKDGKIYPLGSGRGEKLREYVNIIIKAINPSVSPLFGVKPYYPHQPMFLVADISEIKGDTGWSPKISFDEGIQRLITSS